MLYHSTSTHTHIFLISLFGMLYSRPSSIALFHLIFSDFNTISCFSSCNFVSYLFCLIIVHSMLLSFCWDVLYNSWGKFTKRLHAFEQIFFCLRTGYYEEAKEVAESSRVSRAFASQVWLYFWPEWYKSCNLSFLKIWMLWNNFILILCIDIKQTFSALNLQWGC